MAQLSWNHFPLTTWYFRRRSKLDTGWVSKSQIWDGCTTLNLRSLHVICEWNVVFWCVLAQPKCRMCYYSSCNLLVPLRKGCDVCSMGWSSAHRGCSPLPAQVSKALLAEGEAPEFPQSRGREDSGALGQKESCVLWSMESMGRMGNGKHINTHWNLSCGDDFYERHVWWYFFGWVR